MLADRPLAPSEIPELEKWVRNGGLLLRFAGPRSADNTTDELGQPATSDPLMPERLLAEDRQLGGALSLEPTGAALPLPGQFAVCQG